MQVKRYLVTTADERTWKFGHPILFLGKWCQRIERKELWESMDAIVAEPFVIESTQKNVIFAYVAEQSQKLLSELVEALNTFHGTNYSNRFWDILLGNWLLRYVTVIFNRYFTLDQALKKYEIEGSGIISIDDYSLATNNSLDFVLACNDDLWNHILYGRILHYIDDVKIKLDLIRADLPSSPCFKQQTNTTEVAFSGKKRLILGLVNHVLPKFCRKNDAVIISSYLPKLEEAMLSLKLKQCPQLWRSPLLKEMHIVPEMRKDFSVRTDGYANFELFIRKQLTEMIPVCFLEGFKQLMEQAKNLPWPSSPKFIFTSNKFDTDEVFKAWTGSKVEKGTPYYVGQHGNNYGTLNKSLYFRETLNCDKFFTWGWTNDSPKNIPAFIFKIPGHRLLKSDPKGGLLLIEFHSPTRLMIDDDFYHYSIYQEEQYKFVETLPKTIQQKLTIRLHGCRSTNWPEKKQWNELYPLTYVDSGDESIRKLINKSRLVVHSYDSTGILETLASNIPTICFWHGGLDHLLPSAKIYYAMLRDVNIIIDTPQQAANFVAQNWSSLDRWWASEKLQNARRLFCNEFARIDNSGVKTLKHLLIKETEHRYY